MRIAVILTLIVVLVFFQAVRFGNAEPTVQTLPATNITDTAAVLNGNLNTNGQDTDWAFKVFDSSGNEIQTVCAGSGNTPEVPGSAGQLPVTCPLNSLQPSTPYGFALIARWHGVSGASGDWQLGSVVSFTTLASSLGGYTVNTIFTNILTFQMDYALSNPTISPAQPKVGDLVTFSATLTALSSNTGYPQDVQMTTTIDGVTEGIYIFTYAGPTGNPETPTETWIATSGSHVLEMIAKPLSANIMITDPDMSNNHVSLPFSVGAAATTPTAPAFDFTMTVSPGSVTVAQGDTAHYTVQLQYSDPSYAGTAINLQLTGLGPGMNWQTTQTGDLTITTTPATPTGTYTISVTGSANGVTHQTSATLIVTSEQPPTTVVTTTSTMSSSQTTTSSESPATSTVSTVNQPAQTSTNTETTTPVGSNLTNIIQQNPSIILVAIILILLAALAFRRKPSKPTPVTQPSANVIYCSKCGNQNASTNQFCRKCGTKLG